MSHETREKIALTASSAHVDGSTTLVIRLGTAVRTEVGVVVLALGALAVHIADDNFVQPAPGTAPVTTC